MPIIPEVHIIKSYTVFQISYFTIRLNTELYSISVDPMVESESICRCHEVLLKELKVLPHFCLYGSKKRHRYNYRLECINWSKQSQMYL